MCKSPGEYNAKTPALPPLWGGEEGVEKQPILDAEVTTTIRQDAP